MKKRILFPIIGSFAMLATAATVTSLVVLSNYKSNNVDGNHQMNYSSNSPKGLLYGKNLELTVGEKTTLTFNGDIDFINFQIKTDKNSVFKNLVFNANSENPKSGSITFLTNSPIISSEVIALTADEYEELDLTVKTKDQNIDIKLPDDYPLEYYSNDSYKVDLDKELDLTMNGSINFDDFSCVSEDGGDSKLKISFEVNSKNKSQEIVKITAFDNITDYEELKISADGYNNKYIKIFTTDIQYDLSAKLENSNINVASIQLEVGKAININLSGEINLQNPIIKSNKGDSSKISLDYQKGDNNNQGVLTALAKGSFDNGCEIVSIQFDHYRELDIAFYTSKNKIVCAEDKNINFEDNKLILYVNYPVVLNLSGNLDFKNVKVTSNYGDKSSLNDLLFKNGSDPKTGTLTLCANKNIKLPETVMIQADNYAPFVFFVSSQKNQLNFKIDSKSISENDELIWNPTDTYQLEVSGKIPLQKLSVNTFNEKMFSNIKCDIDKSDSTKATISLTLNQLFKNEESFWISANGYNDFKCFVISNEWKMSINLYDSGSASWNEKTNTLDIDSNKTTNIIVTGGHNRFDNIKFDLEHGSDNFSFDISCDEQTPFQIEIKLTPKDANKSLSEKAKLSVDRYKDLNINIKVNKVLKPEVIIWGCDLSNKKANYQRIIHSNDEVYIPNGYLWIQAKNVPSDYIEKSACYFDGGENVVGVISSRKSENIIGFSLSKTDHIADGKYCSLSLRENGYDRITFKFVQNLIIYNDDNNNSDENKPQIQNGSEYYESAGSSLDLITALSLDEKKWKLDNDYDNPYSPITINFVDKDSVQKIHIVIPTSIKSGYKVKICFTSDNKEGNDFYFYINIF